jgi:predicted regulator of Ras-like GTPase activity (Roadblock/LC7/MglB family)
MSSNANHQLLKGVHMRRLAILAACMAFPVIAQTITIQPSTSAPATETRTFAFKDGGRLKVSNVNGYIKISAWDKDEAVLNANFKPSSDNEHARLEVERDSNSLELVVKNPETNRKKYRFTGPKRGAFCEIELNVPRHIVSKISSVNGAISVSNISGRIDASAVNGCVALENTKGSANISTVNGSVVANVQNSEDYLVISTVNGSITLVLLNPSNATLKASTINGRVQFTNNDDIKNLKVNINRNKIKTKFGDGSGNIELTSVNGLIDVK